MHLPPARILPTAILRLITGYGPPGSPQLIVHTGDYIYESIYKDGVRRIPVPVAITLDDYRLLHACYKLDPHLQEAHAAATLVADLG